MRWIANRTNLRRRLGEEQGATAVMVALLLVVLLGIGAFILDIGNQMWESRMQQNSADAAALAVGQDCAAGDCDTYQDTAQDFAGENTGRGSHGTVVADSSSSDPYSGLSSDDGKVTVRAETGNAGDAGTLSTWLAGLIGTDQLAANRYATAAWGPASVAEGFPLAVCEDLWNDNRPDSDGNPGPRIDIRYKGTGGDPVENDCLDPADDNFNPGSQPGNFSWLETAAGTCEAEFDFSEGEVTGSGDTGNNVNGDCSDTIDDMISAIQAHKDDPANNDLPVKVLPIYSTVEGSGTNATYELETLGAFEFSGLKTRANQNIVVNEWSDPLCTGNSANHLCVQGRFVTEVSLDGEIDESADSDVMIVELIQ